jgi:hypothetical protein
MTTSKDYMNVIKSIHNVQQNVGVVGKKSTADTGKYKYRYADMTTIWNAIRSELNAQKLTIVQSPTSTSNNVLGDFLTTTVYHETGEFITDTMRLITNRDDPQGLGAAITYMKRYMIVSMFGLVTDDDNDAADSRQADGEMKKEWVRAYAIVAKKANPEAIVSNNDFIKFMTDVYGKHPTKVLAREHQAVLDTINAFSG